MSSPGRDPRDRFTFPISRRDLSLAPGLVRRAVAVSPPAVSPPAVSPPSASPLPQSNGKTQFSSAPSLRNGGDRLEGQAEAHTCDVEPPAVAASLVEDEKHARQSPLVRRTQSIQPANPQMAASDLSAAIDRKEMTDSAFTPQRKQVPAPPASYAVVETAEPSVDVRIGRVEVRFDPQPASAPVPQQTKPGGFTDYTALRRYVRHPWSRSE